MSTRLLLVLVFYTRTNRQATRLAADRPKGHHPARLTMPKRNARPPHTAMRAIPMAQTHPRAHAICTSRLNTAPSDQSFSPARFGAPRPLAKSPEQRRWEEPRTRARAGPELHPQSALSLAICHAVRGKRCHGSAVTCHGTVLCRDEARLPAAAIARDPGRAVDGVSWGCVQWDFMRLVFLLLVYMPCCCCCCLQCRLLFLFLSSASSSWP